MVSLHGNLTNNMAEISNHMLAPARSEELLFNAMQSIVMSCKVRQVCNPSQPNSTQPKPNQANPCHVKPSQAQPSQAKPTAEPSSRTRDSPPLVLAVPPVVDDVRRCDDDGVARRPQRGAVPQHEHLAREGAAWEQGGAI